MYDPRQAVGPTKEAEEPHIRRQLQSHLHVHPDKAHELPNEDGRGHVIHSEGKFLHVTSFSSAGLRSGFKILNSCWGGYVKTSAILVSKQPAEDIMLRSLLSAVIIDTLQIDAVLLPRNRSIHFTQQSISSGNDFVAWLHTLINMFIFYLLNPDHRYKSSVSPLVHELVSVLARINILVL